MGIIFRKPDFKVWIVFVFVFLQMGTGCTFLENLRQDPEPESISGERVVAGETVDRRASELAGLEESAAGRAAGEIALGRTVLEEMAYFKEEGNVEGVRRLDVIMGKALDSAREAIEKGPDPATEEAARLEKENRALRSRVDKAESSVAGLKEDIFAKETVSEIKIESLVRRLETAEKARNDAIREVVRTRSRIEGMASKAEASAMFAEARVLVDRMKEDAFNDRARDDLELARGYLASGKKELDAANPGGAAYLFDLVSSVYEVFRTSNPRRVTISVKKALVYKTASGSSSATGSLSRGQTAIGLQIRGDRVQVKLPSGLTGWVRKNQVH